MPMSLADLQNMSYIQKLKLFATDNNLYQQEMKRVSDILQTRPDYAMGLKHYAIVKAVGNGIDPTAALNGNADLSKYQWDPKAINQLPGAPSVPTIADYTSKYSSEIDKLLQNINNQPQFSYDPNTDPAFQAYLDTYQQKGQTAFNNQLGSLAAASGGQVSSWASSAASQAQNAYVQQGMSAMPSFMNAAYQRYRDSIGDSQTKLQTLLALDDRDFSRYQTGIDNNFRVYSAQLDQYTKAIELKSQQFSDALERTKINGFVTNEDALIIGVKPGTPSAEAQKFAQEKQLWLEQQAVQIKNEKELLQIKFDQEKKLISYRDSVNGTGSGSSSSKANEADFNKYKGKVDSFMNEYENFAYGDKISEMTPQEISRKELQYVNRFDSVLESLANNPYITDAALSEIWAQIQLTDFYKNIYLKYRGQKDDNGGWMDAGASSPN